MSRPHTQPSPTRPPFTDSPWFWTYFFCTGALVALFLMGPKYIERQPQIERQFSARQSGGQAVAGSEGPVKPSTSDHMIIPLGPLYIIMAFILSIAWIVLWFQRFRVRPTGSSTSA